jgi:hypothetical protein
MAPVARPAARSEAEFRKALSERKALCFCLEPFSKKHEPVSMECCKQVVGEQCLDAWIKSGNVNNNRCPHCRHVLFGNPWEDDLYEDDLYEDHIYQDDLWRDGGGAYPGVRQTVNVQAWQEHEGMVPVGPDLEGLWYTMDRCVGLFVALWTEIQANIETIRNPRDRTSQWKQILDTVRRVVRDNQFEGEANHWDWVRVYLLALQGVPGPGIFLTQRQGMAYRATGPLLDCAYLMSRCAEMMPSNELGRVDARLFRAIVGNQGGSWCSLYERFEIRDWFLWDRVFGSAVRVCHDRQIPALRLLSAMLLCQLPHRIKQAFSGPNENTCSTDINDWREDNKCLLVMNNLRRELGPAFGNLRYERLAIMSDFDLLLHWREPRYVPDVLFTQRELSEVQVDHYVRLAVDVDRELQLAWCPRSMVWLHWQSACFGEFDVQFGSWSYCSS